MAKKKKSSYSGKAIRVLKGLEAVRERPGMYLGDVYDGTALHHLIWEVIDNAVDEHLAGHCNRVEVELCKGEEVRIRDWGRGIPVDMHEEGRSTLEVIMTTLHAGGKFDTDSYAQSAGLHGVGVSAVNAVSKSLTVFVHRDGALWGQSYEKGYPLEDVEPVDDSDDTGTEVRFTFDPDIFKEVLTYDADKVQKRLQELAFLNAGLTIEFIDSRGAKKKGTIFHYEGGTAEYLEDITKKKTSLHPDPIRLIEKGSSSMVEVAMQWTESQNSDIRCYTNNVFNGDGGTHLTGFRNGITRSINSYASEKGLLKGLASGLTGDDVREGLVAIVNLRIPDPSFSSQTKDKLVTARARTIVEGLLKDQFSAFLETNPRVARKIVERAVLAAKAREAARKAREAVTRKSAMDPLALPGKLADCQSKNPEESEIFIVEGDSAGGSTKQGRNRRFQAVLPLRGKVLNTERSVAEDILDNKELGTVINALGCGLETAGNFKLDKLRYHRIIILTDADIDGAHIRTLLLTFFYRHMPQLVWDGYLYIGAPPLYMVKIGSKSTYISTDIEYKQFLKEHEGEKMRVSRFKGLGEMNADTLWHTTLDPDNRKLIPVRISDAVAAEGLFETLMGENVEDRRNYINKHALEAENIDF